MRAHSLSPPAPGRIARAIPHPVHEPPRVLVAEDDSEMRWLLVEAMREDGYEVHEVADGGRLLVQLAQDVDSHYEHVDLIVSDICMPICTGLQIVEALRGAHCGTPIILMTAFGDTSTRSRAELMGAMLFDKPFEMDDLRTAVVGLLARSRAQSAL